jgi:hypothetical protein
MDWLHEVRDDLDKQVFDEVANLLNLDVDLLFCDYPANRSSDFVVAGVVRVQLACSVR